MKLISIEPPKIDYSPYRAYYLELIKSYEEALNSLPLDCEEDLREEAFDFLSYEIYKSAVNCLLSLKELKKVASKELLDKLLECYREWCCYSGEPDYHHQNIVEVLES